MNSGDESLATRINHDNGIVEFVIKDSSDAAVLEYLRLMIARFDEVIAQPESDRPLLRHLHVFEAMRLPSLLTIFRAFRDIYRKHVHVPPARVVYLHRPGLVVSMANVFVRLLKRARPTPLAIRFMTMDRRDEAIRWLLADE